MAVVRVMCRSAQREQVLAVADQRGEPSPDVEWLVADDKDAELRHAPLADAIMTSRDTEVIDAAPRCRWVQVGSAGVDSVDMTQLNERGIELTNAAVIYGPALADHNMALILAWSRQLPFLFEAQQRGVWESRSNFPAGELAEQTILIVGLGGAGTMTAARAKGFGMHVIGTRRRADEPLPPCVDEQFDSSRETLHELLPSADWVALCCGLNDETYHLFDAEAFALMKSSAGIVTIARGGCIDTDALVNALQSGEITFAGLDVTEPEPLPTGHPLWSMPNVVITPHSSGHSPHNGSRMSELLYDNVVAFAAGEPLRNVVDKTADQFVKPPAKL